MQHQVVSREQWLAARLGLLKEEKELTRRSDELARRRQELPWVRIDKEYRFETDEGIASLSDLFRGRSQLLVYHFMFGPDYTAGVHPARRSRTASTASPSTWPIMTSCSGRCRGRRWRNSRRTSGGWGGRFPGRPRSATTSTSTSTSRSPRSNSAGGLEYNYRRGGHVMEAGIGPGNQSPSSRPCAGTDVATYTRERPGMSAFVLEDGVVYHSYSTYARGGRPLGHVPVARPRPQRAQREGPLASPPRRIRAASSKRRLVLPRGGAHA